MNYLNLIRYKNLLAIALFQILIYYCIISPFLTLYGIATLSSLQIIFLILSSVFIAAGGFVINEYFDTRIDQLNRPDKVIVGVTVPKKTASALHIIFTAIGFLMGVFVAWQLRSLTLGLIALFIPGLLWFYSASYKRQFLIGNIIVALMAAFVPLVPAIAQAAGLQVHYGEIIQALPVNAVLYSWTCGFAFFIFLTILIRSLIKNLASEYGDREMESRTMPIVLGVCKTKIVIYALMAITVGLLIFVNFKYIIDFPWFGEVKSTLPIRYILCAVALPFGYLTYLLIKAKKSADYNQAATFCGFVLILEMLFTLVFYFLFCKAQGIPMFGTFLIQP